jgi:hypothetical protein
MNVTARSVGESAKQTSATRNTGIAFLNRINGFMILPSFPRLSCSRGCGSGKAKNLAGEMSSAWPQRLQFAQLLDPSEHSMEATQKKLLAELGAMHMSGFRPHGSGPGLVSGRLDSRVIEAAKKK